MLLFILLSLTCVSAVDDNQTIDNEVLESDTVTDEILTAEPGDFTELQNNITNCIGNEVKLEKNYTYNPDSDTDLNTGIKIEKDNFVIDGNGYTINGNNQARIFYIDANNVTLKNIRFINANASSEDFMFYGGAIFFVKESNGNVTGCSFENNRAIIGGGAIYCDDKTNVTVTGCNFTGNTLTYSSIMGGGAICVQRQSEATVIGCNFTANKANEGGAIYSYENLIVENSYFAFNTATAYGGAINFWGYANEQKRIAKNNTFINNSAEDAGGAITILNSGEINNNTFINNHAKEGGAAYLYGNVNSTNDKFINNTAETGGAISVYGGLTAKLDGDYFEDNAATVGTNNINLQKEAQLILLNIDQDLSPFREAVITLVNITDETLYGETVNITVMVTCDDEKLMNGTAFITINNVNYTATVENGTATICIPNLRAENYNNNVTYRGTNYTSPSIPVSFTVNKIIPNITFDYLPEYLIGTDINVTLYGPNDRNGSIVFSTGDIDYAYNLTGALVINLGPNLEMKEYTITITYLENDKYSDTKVAFTFRVTDRFETILYIDGFNTDETTNNTIINVNITDKAGKAFEISGNLTVIIKSGDDIIKQIKSDNLDSCNIALDLGVIKPGVHNVSVVYNGNDYYKESSNMTEYEFPQVAYYDLPVYATNITYNESNATIRVIVPDGAEKNNLTIIVNNVAYPSENYIQNDNIVTLNITGLNAGNYEVKVQCKYATYSAMENTTSFTVFKASSSIDIDVESIYYIDDEIVIKLTPSIDSEITVYINNQEYNVNPNNTINLTAIEGEYTVVANLAGDKNHNASKANATFTVDKIIPNISFDYLPEYMIGTDINVTLYGPNDRNGSIVFSTGDIDYAYNLTGALVINLGPNLEMKEYTITITYLENDKYKKNEVAFSFNVTDRYESILYIDSIVTDENTCNTTINVTITDNAGNPLEISGNLTVIVKSGDDIIKQIKTDDLDSYKITLDLGVIKPGAYNFTAVYSGDTHNRESSNMTEYEVPLVSNYDLPVYVTNITYNESNATIRVIVPDGAEKNNLTIIVNNVAYPSENYIQNDNIVTLNITGLDADHYEVKVQYKDNVYDFKENTTSFTVFKASSSIDIDVESSYYVDDEIVIKLTPSIDNSEITVYINNQEYNVNPNNTINLTAIEGEYTVVANLAGDKNHNASKANATFTVKLKIPNISVEYLSKYITGTDAYVKVYGPSDINGLILISGDFNWYKNDFTGDCVFNFGDELEIREYNINITYSRNEKYEEKTVNVTFSVIDRNETILYIDSIATNETTGNNIINVTITDKAGNPLEISGNLTVIIKSGDDIIKQIKTDNLDSCKITLDLGIFVPGVYNFTAVYSGDTYNKESSNMTEYEVPLVSNYDLPVYATNITYNESDEIIIVDVHNGGKKDNLTIIVNNVAYPSENYIQNDNIVTLNITGLDAGNYEVKVQYKYGANSVIENTTSFTVYKANSTVMLDDIVLNYGDSINVTVTTEGAAGITAKIGNDVVDVTNYTIAISGLDAGNYNLSITTITDKNHNNVTKTVRITVNKDTTKITAKAVPTTYQVKKNLVITLKDSQGKALSGVKLTVKLKGTKTYTTDKNGQIKINVAKLVPKTYTAKVTFAGNDNYKASSANVKVTVKKAKAKITAKKKKFKSNKKVKKYKITLKSGKKPIKRVKVTLKIGKKKYKAKTNSKGKAIFKIKKLTKKGKYKAVIKFKGNKYYKKATKKTKIKLS